MKIILGSTSEPRRQVMEAVVGMLGTLGTFETMAPNVNEKAIRRNDPRELTSELAMAKSRALRLQVTEPAILITADTVVTWNGIIREKPENANQARLFLRTYREGPAIVVTSVLGWNARTGQERADAEEATVWFQGLTEDAIEYLVKQDVTYTGAGGFAVGHEAFEPHIERIDGEVGTAMGLPCERTGAVIASLRG